MILVPQMYLRNGRVVLLDGTTSPLIQEDPVATVEALKEAGAEAIYLIDLGIPPVGHSPHIPLIKKLHDDLDLAIYVGGTFKVQQSVEGLINTGIELVVIGSVAYQQPAFLSEACKAHPGKIAAHIDVKGGRVTIPGYTVVANKTAFDYSEKFISSGVRCIFYSDTGANGQIGTENLTNLMAFCKRATARVICTSEISSLADIEKIAKLSAPRMDGILIGKALYDGRVDLKSAVTMVNDLMLESGEESTLTQI